MKRVVDVWLLAVALTLAAAPALAQTTPGSLGGNQVGTGAVEPQQSSSASSSTITTTPVTSAATPSTPAAGPAVAGTTATSTTGTSAGGSSGGGGGSGGSGSSGSEAPCLSASGSVTDVNADEFGLDCPQ